MISSAAIQKLERYGQLGLKRRTVEDFVHSSLKDPKRSNVYALTHLPSWQESHAALRRQDVRRDAAVSDSLLYAMSFATALVSHHVHRRLTQLGVPPTAEDVFDDDLTSAKSLIATLKNMAVHLAQDAHCLRNSGSTALTQAAAHLFSSVADLTFFTSTLCVVRPVTTGRVAGTGGDTQGCHEASRQISVELHQSTIALLAAVSRVLRRAMAQYPVESLLLRVRTCAALLRQQMHKSATQGAIIAESMPRQPGNAEDEDGAQWRTTLAAQPVLYVLCDCATLPDVGSSALFESFSLFQKASLLHALTSEDGSAELFAPFAAKLRRLLNHLLAATACNRATRYVVYYRGDDVKLMQNNIRQAGDYALHTFVTSPPTENTLVQSLEQLAPRSVTRRRCALLLVQWIASCSYFFQSFCSDESWTAFAQEQRRRALIQQSNERRGQRRRAGRHGDGPRPGDHQNNATSDPGAAMLDGDGGGGTAAEETHSVTSGGSAVSLASRASLLSTLSRRSAASYLSFISVLRPEGDEAAASASHAMHESSDGNTNLPLILLEELVLGLQHFMRRLPQTLLGDLDLRCLVWQSIGQLLGFVQDSLGGAAGDVSSHAVGLTTLFDLGQDIRYNHGLGYESLGLLFATVLSPQLELQVTHKDAACPSDAVWASAREGASGRVRVCIDAALSRCLAAYERVAPQVVDANLPVVVRIAARAALVAQTTPDEVSGEPSAASSSPGAFLRFLVNMITRLGKNNQLTLLLDALAAHRGGTVEDGDKGAVTAAEDVDDAENVTALQLTLAHPAVRAALMAASGLCLDPEQLLGRLIEYIAACAGTGQGPTAPVTRRPADVLLLLQLVATLLEGLQPTAASSSAILERSTELELQLGAFLLQLGGAGGQGATASNVADAEGGADGGAVFVLRPKTRRQLWLHGLFAIYQARTVTIACLRDLGSQHVEAYVEMLEQTLWQVQTHTGSLLGSLTALQLRENMSATTHMVLAPYVHVQCLIPQLALQRLALAKLVSTLLGISAGPVEDTRQLVDVVLDCFIAGEELPVGAQHARLARLANTVTEEEWGSVVYYGKSQQVQRAMRALLLAGFTMNTPTVADTPDSPVWLRRCLRSVPGALLRAITDLLSSLEVEDGMATTGIISNSGEAATAMARKEAADDGEEVHTREIYLAGLLDTLQYVYSVLGHLPLWTVLLRRALSWLYSSTRRGDGGRAGHSLVARLVHFIAHCLLCEGRSQDILRRALLMTAGQSAGVASGETRRVSKGREYTIAYLNTIDVVSTKAAVSAQVNVSDLGTETTEMLMVDGLMTGDTLRALCGMLFDAEMITLLTATTQAEVAGHAMTVLAFLYHTAVSALTTARGRGGGDLVCVGAERFLQQVAVRFRQLCDIPNDTDTTPRLLLDFLGSLKSPLVPPAAGGRVAPTPLHTLWQDVLHGYAAQLLRLGGEVDRMVPVTAAGVQCFNALYHRLSLLGGGPVGQTVTHKRPRGEDAAASTENTTSEAGSASNPMTDFCPCAGEGAVLGTLWGSGLPHTRAVLERAVRFVVALLAHGRAAGLTSLWLMYAQHAQAHYTTQDKDGRRSGSEGRAWQGHATPTVLGAVLGHDGGRWYDAVPSDDEALSAAVRDVAAAIVQALRPEGVAPVTTLEQRTSKDLYSVSFLRDNLIAMLEALRLLRGSTVPGFLYTHLHSMLHAAIKTPRSDATVAAGATSEQAAKSTLERYKLLVVVADTMLQLSAVPGFRFALLSTHVRRLLVAGARPEMRVVLAGDKVDGQIGATLRCKLLALCSAAVSVLQEDELFLDEMWLYVHECVMAASDATLPTQTEVTAMLTLLARSWLFLPYHAEAAVWRRAALLPSTLGALFQCILRGVEIGCYERHVLNQLSSFLYQLVKQAETDARVPQDDAVDADDDHTTKRFMQARRGKTARIESVRHETSDQVRRITLTAVLTTLFELAQHHVAVFTTYSNDLDFVAADLLKALGRHHLPRHRASPITTPDEAHGRTADVSDTTLSDLAFTCVGDEDGKALLRQAALRVEEEEEDQQGQLVGERRHIFRVD